MKSHQPPTKNFQETALLKNIPENIIPHIIDSGVRKTIEKGKMLFHQGDPAKWCYLLETGQIKLAKLHEDGREAIIRYIGSGDVAAAVVVLKDKDYPVTAQALAETKVICWDKKMIFQLMLKYPQFAINMLSVILERLEEMQDRFLEISAEQTERRIARALLRIMKHAGTKTNEGIRIDVPITRENIADFTGTTHYTVSRVFSDWKRKGWVTSTRQKINITDVHSLVKLSENL